MSADFPFEDEGYRPCVNLSNTTNDNRFEEPIIYRGLAPASLETPASFWSSFESPDQFVPVNIKPLLHKLEPGVLAQLEPIGEPNIRQDIVDDEWELEDIKGPFSGSLSLESAVWLEPLSSFDCGAREPHTVLNRVCSHLTATHVPFSIDTSQASVEGRLESGAGCCGFVLRAFRGGCGNAVFELQRRHGCSLLFADLFQRVLSWLGSAVKQQLALPWETSDTMLPLPDLGEIPPPLTLHVPQPPLDLTPGDTTSLLTMLDSEQQDVQLEGLRVLATAAKESTHSAAVVCDMLAARTREWELALPQQDTFQKGSDLSYALARWKKVLTSTIQEQDLNPGAEN
jgi:hypothetical protein